MVEAIPHPVLAHHYENVQSLRSYLSACLPRETAALVLQPAIDRSSFVDLVGKSWVAWNASNGAPRHCPYDDTSDTSLEYIIRLIQREILNADHKSSNVLCFGFKVVSPLQNEADLPEFPFQTEGNLVNKVSNTTLTNVQESADWKLLLSRSIVE